MNNHKPEEKEYIFLPKNGGLFGKCIFKYSKGGNLIHLEIREQWKKKSYQYDLVQNIITIDDKSVPEKEMLEYQNEIINKIRSIEFELKRKKMTAKIN